MRFGNRLRPRPRATRSGFTLAARFDSCTGYGQLACNLLEGFLERGVDFEAVAMMTWEPWGQHLPETVKARLKAENTTGRELLLAPPAEVRNVCPTVHLTMWESDTLTAGVADLLNRRRLLIVPSEWVREVFIASGVTVPIVKVPLAVADCFLHPRPLPEGSFTVGVGGRTQHGGVRKGLAQAARVFCAAFPTETDVRLRVKTFPDCDLSDLPDDPRIEVEREALTTAGMVDFYASLHCWLTMSLGEGFGLQPLECMGLGRPVIGTQATGHAEYLDPSVGLIVPHTWESAAALTWTHGHYDGRIAMPDFEAAVEQLRRAYRDRGLLERLGKNAAVRAAEFTQERFLGGVLGALQEVGYDQG